MKNVVDETTKPAIETGSETPVIDSPTKNKTDYTGIIVAVLVLVIGIAVAMYINNKKKKELNPPTPLSGGDN